MTSSASTPLRFVVLLTSVVVALLLLLTGTVSARAGDETLASDAVVRASVHHQVVAGDSLWTIAEGYTVPGEDVRIVIHDIKVANGLDTSVIDVGQVLVIPVEF
jgi:LysM repeat protein